MKSRKIGEATIGDMRAAAWMAAVLAALAACLPFAAAAEPDGTLVNTGLNWVLIYGNLGAPRLEVRGAAYATLIARFF